MNRGRTASVGYDIGVSCKRACTASVFLDQLARRCGTDHPQREDSLNVQHSKASHSLGFIREVLRRRRLTSSMRSTRTRIANRTASDLIEAECTTTAQPNNWTLLKCAPSHLHFASCALLIAARYLAGGIRLFSVCAAPFSAPRLLDRLKKSDVIDAVKVPKTDCVELASSPDQH